jgi:hypothetical protein
VVPRIALIDEPSSDFPVEGRLSYFLKVANGFNAVSGGPEEYGFGGRGSYKFDTAVY